MQLHACRMAKIIHSGGKGVSRGHSDAIRRIEGVKDARQYTIPVESALEAVRSGSSPELTTREKHTRECFVVAEEGADQAKIENEIKTMPNYFSDYDTTVHFITEEELKRDHNRLPHGGFVLRSGKTGWNKENHHIIEYSLKLDSNPEFTSSIIVAYARAAYKMNQKARKAARPSLMWHRRICRQRVGQIQGRSICKNLLNKSRKRLECRRSA